MSLRVMLNGSPQDMDGLDEGASLAELVQALGFKADRVAVERNGEIVGRRSWAEVRLVSGDKLEVVHFVGGGIVDTKHPYR